MIEIKLSVWEALVLALIPSPISFLFRRKKEQNMETQGIKETKEVLIALNEVSISIIKALRDGMQLAKDADALYTDLVKNEEVKTKIKDAIDGYKEVPSELKDVNIMESAELAVCQATYLPKLIDALKDPAKHEQKQEEKPAQEQEPKNSEQG